MHQGPVAKSLSVSICKITYLTSFFNEFNVTPKPSYKSNSSIFTSGKEKIDGLYNFVKIVSIPLCVYFLGRWMVQFDRMQEDQEKMKIDVAVVLQISKENQINIRNFMMFENERQRRIEQQNQEAEDKPTGK